MPIDSTTRHALIEERIFRGVMRPIDPDACWLSPKSMSNGYARVRIRSLASHPLRVHMLAWEIASGNHPIPDGFDICHTCDVRNCIRNDEPGVYVVNGIARPRFGHLFLGTRADNMADAKSKHRTQSGDARRTTMLRVAARGERAGNAKLTEANVLEIRRLSFLGTMQQQIADQFGIDQSTVSLIVRRKKWSHI